MNEVRTIRARHSDGSVEDCSLEIDGWELIFSGGGMRLQRFADRDLFEAFLSLRKTLEEKGIQLLCAGARPEAFPSGMSRDMGGGRKAYITKIGSPASALVDIFEDAEAGMVGTVSQQLSFHQQWVQSLGR
jgi:hypothetical protein